LLRRTRFHFHRRNPNLCAVIETIAMKESQRIAHAPGVVAILGSFTPADPRAFEGRGVRIGVLTMIRRNSIC
jgi:hypothetical protein